MSDEEQPSSLPRDRTGPPRRLSFTSVPGAGNAEGAVATPSDIPSVSGTPEIGEPPPLSSVGSRRSAATTRSSIASDRSRASTYRSSVASHHSGTSPLGALGRAAGKTRPRMFTREHHRQQSIEMDVNDYADKGYLISPVESVYSYYLFMPPIEQRRRKQFCTLLLIFALWLIILNFVMQFGLLLVVGKYIMHEHSRWVGKIIELDDDRIISTRIFETIKSNAFFDKQLAEEMHCTSGTSLCQKVGDQITCAPPAVHFLSNWTQLDLDGDGIWQRDEAEDHEFRKRVQCKHNVDPLQVYDMMVENLQASHRLHGLRDQNLKEGLAIHRAYADFNLGETVMCHYMDEEMCGSMFAHGVFDGALKTRPFPEMQSPASADRYCRKLLKHRCPRMFPESYTLRRVETVQQCGMKHYTPILYKTPEHHSLELYNVNFAKEVAYDNTATAGFHLYVTILLVVFLTTMCFELKSIGKVLLWVMVVPVDRTEMSDAISRKSVKITRAEMPRGSEISDGTLASSARASIGGASQKSHKSAHFEDSDFESSEDEESGIRMSPKPQYSMEIRAVRADHRLIVLLVTLLRCMLWVCLTYSGVVFLTSDTRYLGLIFDALSLVFIIQIDELLYETMIRGRLREDHCSIEPMEVRHSSLQAIVGSPSMDGAPVFHAVQVDILLSFLLLIMSVAIVMEYSYLELTPLRQALSCACRAEGPSCVEATAYSKEWWDSYWHVALPKAMRDIRGLMNAEEAFDAAS